MQQKADKGIEKTIKEQIQLARILDVWDALVTQRHKKGKLK